MPTADEMAQYKPSIEEIEKLTDAGFALDIKPDGSVLIGGNVLTKEIRDSLLKLSDDLTKACKNYREFDKNFSKEWAEYEINLDKLPIGTVCASLRQVILEVSKSVLALKKHEEVLYVPLETEPDKKAEMIANIMLAYRHLEDARMRIGKVIQAHDGGVSIYDSAKYYMNIKINGKPYQWTASEISYEELLKLASIQPESDMDIAYGNGTFFDFAGMINKDTKRKIAVIDGMLFTIEKRIK